MRIPFRIITVCCVAVLMAPAVYGDLVDRLLDCEQVKAARAEFDELDQKDKEALIPSFKKAIKSGYPDYAVGEFLKKMCSASIPMVIEVLNDERPEIRETGVGLLTYLECDEAIPLLERVVETERYNINCLQTCILGNRKHVHVRLLPSLIKVLDKPRCNDCVCRALEVLGPEAEPAIPALIQCLEKSRHPEIDPFINLNLTDVMKVLQMFGPKALPAANILVELLGNDYAYARSTAAETLAKIGLETEPAIIAAIDSQNARQREGAVEALSLMQPYSERAVATFLHLVQDENDSVREYATEALGKVDTDAAREALARAKEKEDKLKRNAEALEETRAERLWTRAEIESPTPPDANHKYPRKLERSLNVTGSNGEQFLVTVHLGDDWPWSVAIWAKQEGESYKRIWENEFDGNNGFIEDVTLFHFQHVPFLHIVYGYGFTGAYSEETLFAFIPEHRLKPVTIEAIDCGNVLKEGEVVMKRGIRSFSDESLAFSFNVWNKNDAECCPTAGSVHGTFKMVGDPLSGQDTKFVADTCVRENPDSK